MEEDHHRIGTPLHGTRASHNVIGTAHAQCDIFSLGVTFVEVYLSDCNEEKLGQLGEAAGVHRVQTLTGERSWQQRSRGPRSASPNIKTV